jgi:hypothetical protein
VCNRAFRPQSQPHERAGKVLLEANQIYDVGLLRYESNLVIVIQSAYLIAGPLEFNKSLQTLIMDGNPIGQSGCRRLIGSCLGFKNSLETQQKDERTVDVSLKDCSLGTVNPSSFDPAEPAGEYFFDMADPYSRLIVRDLLKIEAMGKGQFQRPTVVLNWVRASFLLFLSSDLSLSCLVFRTRIALNSFMIRFQN